MIVYWVALAETLFYLCSIPIHVAVYLKTDDGIRLYAGFSAFEKRFARRQAAKRLSQSKPQSVRFAGPGSKKLRIAMEIISRMHSGSIFVCGSFSTGDAASSAILTGGVHALEQAARLLVPDTHFHITPDFNASRTYADLRGMISFRSGQIIYAAVSGAVKNTNRRLKQWINIRSKA